MDLKQYASLGISCAALRLSDVTEPILWSGFPKLSQPQAAAIVNKLLALVAEGYTVVSWNGCSFDFWVLATESGLIEDCAALALHHIDLMMQVTFTAGHYLGFEKALRGAGLSGKKKEVTLRDGSRLMEMTDGEAPRLWARGESDAVLSYLRQDVDQLLMLAFEIRRCQFVSWTSNSGRRCTLEIPQLLPASACFGIPEPDTSWMSNPPRRESFVDWIPRWQSRVSDYTVTALRGVSRAGANPSGASKAGAQRSRYEQPARPRGCMSVLSMAIGACILCVLVIIAIIL
jgi:hypothetical protein